MTRLGLLLHNSGGVLSNANGHPALLHRGLQLAGPQLARVPANLTMPLAASAQ